MAGRDSKEAGIAMIEGVGEACGVFGVYTPGEAAAELCYFGLFALQHRGQESAGIAVSDGMTVTVAKNMGLVDQVFDERVLAGLQGHLGIGHTRYSTMGSSMWENAQPAFRQVGDTGLALAHNGNLTNTSELHARYGSTGASSDSELMCVAIAQAVEDGRSDGRQLERAVAAALPQFEGAFSLALMDQGHLIGVRDPRGFRPLCLGRIGVRGWVIASESSALDLVGATMVREIEAGEMVVVDATGIRSVWPFEKAEPALCLFEFVYFARSDSILYGQNIHAARVRMGKTLAIEAPQEADVVVPVPESGIPAAQGFAVQSGIPYADGLVKNRYVGRTFIEPSSSLRDRGIRLKLNPIPATLAGRSIVLVDDSIVRGTTTRKLVAMVREAGATEVHLRVSSPPYRWPCFYGMDTSDPAQLLASDMGVEEIAAFLGVDSLAYLSLQGLLDATEAEQAGFCTACLSGNYPTPVPLEGDKLLLERL